MRPISPPTIDVQEAAKRLGERIRVRRKSLPITLTQLEKKTGIHRTTLGRLERGDTTVSLGIFLSVLESLHELAEIEQVIAQPDVAPTKRRAAPPVINREF